MSFYIIQNKKEIFLEYAKYTLRSHKTIFLEVGNVLYIAIERENIQDGDYVRKIAKLTFEENHFLYQEGRMEKCEREEGKYFEETCIAKKEHYSKLIVSKLICPLETIKEE